MSMSKRKKTKTARLWHFLKIQLLLILMVVLTIAGFYLFGYSKEVGELRDEAQSFVRSSDISTFKNNETSIAYDANGNVISIMVGDKDVYYTSISDMPEYAKEAIISIEDKKFYDHPGFDLKAIARAVVSAIEKKEITQGGSTITQQLARNTFLSNEKTWQRKVEEIFIATELEKKYSKDQILEFYMNNAYFSNGYYGFQAASRGYFDCDLYQLSLSQICFLCAIPNGPAKYNPVEHMENTLSRRDLILQNLYEDGKISTDNYESALTEKITLKRPEKIKNNYLETYSFYCATRVLMELNGFEFRNIFESDIDRESYLEEYNAAYSLWNKKLYTGGYRIYTSLDLDIQDELQEAIDSNLSSFTDVTEDGQYELQAAGVCLDNSNGHVRAIVGGRFQEAAGYTLNRAYQSFRQPGSSIKPILVYAPQVEKGYTPEQMVVDEEIEDGPKNSDGAFWGPITVRKALAYSRNTVAYGMLEELTPAVGLDYLQQMGFEHLSKEDYRPIIAIGGFTYGVTPVEMAGGYGTLANDGIYRRPDCIVKITDSTGLTLYTEDKEGTPVFSESTSRIMTNMLMDVADYGTAKGTTIGNIPIAVKTGTTNSNKDGWFCGYSPYYTTTIWVGYDIPKKLEGLSGSSYPRTIWQNFMTNLHKNLPARGFKPPFGELDDNAYTVIDGELNLDEYIEDTDPLDGVEILNRDLYITNENGEQEIKEERPLLPSPTEIPGDLLLPDSEMPIEQQLQDLNLPPGTEITVAQ